MKDKIILTDIDGVVLNWESQFHKWMKARGHDIVNYARYDISETYSMAYHKAEEYTRDFNTSGYIMELPTFRDSLSGIAILKDAGYKFIAITSVGDDYYTDKLRRVNLENLFGADTFVELHCINANKKPLLQQYRPISDFWIEDTEHNAELGVELGYTTFLFNHLYNQNYQNSSVIRVNSWREVCKTIIGTTW